MNNKELLRKRQREEKRINLDNALAEKLDKER